MNGISLGKPTLFKYVKKEHAESFMDSGVVRIGTLYEYYNMDKYGEEIGDNQEGMVFCQIKKDQYDVIKNDLTPPEGVQDFIREMVITSPEIVYFENFVAGYMPKDQYMYCTSQIYSKSIMHQFGYDSCIEIVDMTSFFLTISEALKHIAKPIGAFQCTYRDRSITYDEARYIYPEIVKTPNYSHQNEIRAIWHSTQPLDDTYHPTDNPAPPLDPVVISAPELRKYCSLT